MSHLLDTHKLPGIGPGRIKRLKAAGFTSLEDLVAAGVDTVAAIPHIPPDVARGAVEAAQAVVGALASAPKAEAAPAPKVEAAPKAAPAPKVEAAPKAAPAPAPKAAPAPKVEAAPKAAPAPKVEAAPKAAPAPKVEAAPEAASMSADDGAEDGGSMGGPKRLLGQLDEVLLRHLPGWSRIRDRARRHRS